MLSHQEKASESKIVGNFLFWDYNLFLINPFDSLLTRETIRCVTETFGKISYFSIIFGPFVSFELLSMWNRIP